LRHNPSLLILLGGQMVNASAGSVGYIMTMTGNQNLADWSWLPAPP
jgi:hypothetical protein